MISRIMKCVEKSRNSKLFIFVHSLFRQYSEQLRLISILTMFVVTCLPIYFTYKFELAWFTDVLYFDTLVEDLISNGSQWVHLRMQPSPSYFPDMLLYIFAYFVSPFALDRIFLVSVAQALLFIIGTVLVLNSMIEYRTKTTVTVSVLFWTLVTYCSYTTGLPLYLNSSNAVIAPAITMLFSFWLAVKIVKEPCMKLFDICVLLALLFLSYVSSIIYVLWFVAPMFLTLLALLVVVEEKLRKRVLYILLIVCASTALGFVLNKYITQNVVVEARLSAGRVGGSGFVESFFQRHGQWAFMWDGLKLILYSKSYAVKSLILFSIIGFMCFVKNTFSTFRKHIFNQQYTTVNNLDVINLFVFFLLFCNFGGVLLSGAFMRLHDHRYFMVSILMLIFYMCRFVIKLVDAKVKKILFDTISIIVAVVVITFVLLNFDELKQRKVSIDEQRSLRSSIEGDLVQCIDENKEKYGLKDGIADYQFGRIFQVYSATDTKVLHFGKSLKTPGFFMSNSEWFTGNGDKIRRPEYNFVIVGDPSITKFYTPEHVRAIVGDESRSFLCPNMAAQIMIYDSSKLNDMYQGFVDSFFNTKAYLNYDGKGLKI